MKKILIIIILLFIQVKLIGENSHDSLVYNNRLKLDQFIQVLDGLYVDSFDISKEVENAIVKVLEDLDPHSVYIQPERVQETEEPLLGGFEGIGVQFNILKDTILVIKAIRGGPSEKLGISAGDKIVKIDGENVASIGINNYGVMRRLKGQKGTKVVVEIYRYGLPNLLKFEIIRDKIPLYSISAAYMIDSVNGYIRLDEFSLTSTEEFKKAITELKKQGLKNLIFDLTSNLGGYMQPAVELADEFLDGNKMIVFTKGLKSPEKKLTSTNYGSFQNGNLVIMIDENSASSSEILTGAVQDWDRGVIVGRRSFGKGLVQQPVELLDKSKIRLTISRYYTPSGRGIQKPYKHGGNNEYRHDIDERLISGELFNEDSVKIDSSLIYYTNNKRKVYGGGGILPDYYVPYDTVKISNLWDKVRSTSALYSFSLRYFERNSKYLKKKFPTFDFKKFVEDKKISDEILDEFMNYLETDYKIKPINEEDFNKTQKLLITYLKGYLAGNLFDESERYFIINQENPIYNKAVEIIRNKDKFEKKGIKYFK